MGASGIPLDIPLHPGPATFPRATAVNDHRGANLRRVARRASGFLLKDVAAADLLAAVRVVAAGDALLAPGVTRRLIADFAARPEPAGRPIAELSQVTGREREVLALVAGGLSIREIAAHLRVSLATVKTHIGRLLAKLQARDRAQLVIVAYETGLVAPTRGSAD